MSHRVSLLSTVIMTMAVLPSTLLADGPTLTETRAALRKAVTFFREKAGTEGGYVYRIKSDFSHREGEVTVGGTTAWIEPPGTPEVGEAFLRAYEMCGEPMLLEAAIETAHALVRGQLLSGGWTEQIEFDPNDRKRYAYRIDGHKEAGKLRNTTTFDDDKSQSCLRFLMRMDHHLKNENEAIHEAVVYAQDAFLRAQYPNGAWPQRFDEPHQLTDKSVLKASYPETWSREFPKEKYSDYYTLNDNTISDMIETMLMAFELYQDLRFLHSAMKAGDFFLLAQMPAPQPGWAQQYNADMHPAWARKFEPPAISGGESQGVMRTLIRLAERTGEQRFLKPIPGALKYYQSCVLDDGKLARFYELKTNRPLYFTMDYELTYEPDDLPTHYGFIVSNKLEGIQRELTAAQERLATGRLRKVTYEASPPKFSSSLEKTAMRVIESMDDHGAWIEDDWIESKQFIRNVETLAGYLGAMKQQ